MQLHERIDKIIEDSPKSIGELLKFAHISAATLGRYRKGGCPKGDFISKMIIFYSLTPALTFWLLTGENPESKLQEEGDLVELKKRREEDRKYGLVKPIRTNGPETVNGDPVVKLYLLREFFQREVNVDGLGILIAQTNNFSPDIDSGDALIMDTLDVNLRDGFYIFKRNEGFFLRKVEVNLDGTVDIFHGNNGANVEHMNFEEVSSSVFGRIWGLFKRFF